MGNYSIDGLWEFLKQVKANAVCLQLYTDRKRRWQRIFNMIVPLSLIALALINCCSVLSQTVAAILAASLAVFTVIKDYAPAIFGLQPSEELREADELNADYERLFIECERLFEKYNGATDIGGMIEPYGELRGREVEKRVRLNKIVRRISKRGQHKITKKVENYLVKVYNIKNQNYGKCKR